MTRTAVDRYLTLLKKCLLEEPFFDNETRLVYLRHCLKGLRFLSAIVY
jgi:hypothetical protein